LNVGHNKDSEDVSQKGVFIRVVPRKDEECERHESRVQKVSDKVFHDHDSVPAGKSVPFLPFCQSLNHLFKNKIDQAHSG
jgi:hypothetical protein